MGIAIMRGARQPSTQPCAGEQLPHRFTAMHYFFFQSEVVSKTPLDCVGERKQKETVASDQVISEHPHKRAICAVPSQIPLALMSADIDPA